MDTWDPRREDFQSSFNTYDRGPGKNLPQKDGSSSGAVQLFIYGVPREVTEDGLRNMFVKAGNVLRVRKPPPKTETQEKGFAFVTMSNVREAEEAIRRFNNFKLDRFTLSVKVAKSEEQKKKEAQQRQEDEEFYSSLQSFKGKPVNMKSSSDTDSDIVNKLNSAGGVVNGVSNGISEKPKPAKEPTTEKGKGRGQVLEELSGLYGSGGSSLWQLRLPRQPGSHGVTPGGDADHHHKKLDERFQSSPSPVDVKKLAPGERYSVEDLTITVSDPCDQAQHSVKTKGEEIKLTHAAAKPHQLQGLLKEKPTHGKTIGRGYDRGHRGDGYKQANGPETLGGRGRLQAGQGQGRPGGYLHGEGHRGQMDPRGYNRYEDYMGGYQNYSDGYMSDSRYGPMYGRQMPLSGHGGNMPMYNPAPTFSPYGGNMGQMGMMRHQGGGYPQMGQYPNDPYLLTPAQTMMNQSMNQTMNQTMNQSMPVLGYGQSGPTPTAPHSPAVSVVEEKRDNCSVCDKLGNSRCGRCKVPYCSKECQKADWPRHKQFCKNISKGLQNEDFEKKFEVTVGDEMIENMKGLIERYTGEQVEITKKPKPAPTQKTEESSETEVKQVKTAGEAANAREKTERQGLDRGGARDSTTQDNRGGVRGRDRPADRDRDQDKGRQSDRKGKTGGGVCHMCNEPGHFSKECPNKDRCNTCNESGHYSKDCPNKYSAVICRYCRESGHYKNECPVNPKIQDKKGGGRDRPRQDRDNQSRPDPEPIEVGFSWDEPAPGKPPTQPTVTSKPLAQSTPSNTPAKPALLSPGKIKETDKQVVPTAVLPLNKEMQIVVTEVISPAKIWCQIVDKESIEILQDVMGKMAEKYSGSQPDVTEVRADQYYGVQFSEDQQWYRGRVTSRNPLLVHFIDFGNSEKRSLTDLRQIDAAWLKHPAQAVHCYLEGISPPGLDTSWSIMVEKKIQTLIPPNAMYTVTAKEVKESEPGFAKFGVVMINEVNENVTDKLLSAGLAVKKQAGKASGAPPTGISPPILMKDVGSVAKEMKVEQEINIMIMDAKSPANFTVQIMEDERIQAFQQFSAELKTVENDAPYKPGVGEMAVAKFSDGGWYRAEVTKVTNTEAEVTYIDFGNEETVDLNNVRKPKATFKTMPAQAMKCGLNDYKAPEIDADNAILLAFFELVSLAAPVKLKAIVKRVVDNVIMIELFSADGKSVNQELQKLASPKEDNKKSDVSAKKIVGAEEAKGTDSASGGTGGASPSSGKESDIQDGELPTDGTTVLGCVTHIVSNDSFYVQLVDYSKNLQDVMGQLNDPANKIKEVKPCDVKVGEYVAALFDDGNAMWYRAKVLELVGTDKVNALYIDFGNSAMIGKTTVKRLESSLRQLPAVAVHCELLGSEGPDKQVSEDFQCMLEQPVNVKGVLKRKDRYVVDLTLTTDNVTSVSTVLGLDVTKVPTITETESPMTISKSQTQGATSSQTPSYPVYPLPLDGTQVRAIVIHVERLDLFCIQLTAEDYQQQLLLLMKELNQICNENPKPCTPGDGECVAAQFNDGGCTLWYRAKALGEDKNAKDKFKVEFVDYGNTDLATKDMIQMLDPQFVTVPALAVKCKLSGCTGTEKKEIVDEFRSVMDGQVPLKIRALKLDNDVYEVDMNLDSDKIEMTDVAEILGLKSPVTQAQTVTQAPAPTVTQTPAANQAETGGARPKTTQSAGARPKEPQASPMKDSGQDLKPIPCEVKLEPRELHPVELPIDGSLVKGAVVFINSLSSFFVQLQNQTLQDGLTQMMTELNESLLTVTKSYTPKTGEVVAAQYSEAEGAPAMWYRARVEKIDNSSVKVFFVDYGNTEQVGREEIQMLSDKFLNLPKMAIRCQLPGSWGIEDIELLEGFKGIMNQPISIKAFKVLSDRYEVDLIMENGISIAETLDLPVDSVTQESSGRAGQAEKKLESTITQTKTVPVAQKELEIFPMPLDGTTVQGAVMAIESLQVFHVQILNEELQNQHNLMMRELQEFCGAAIRPYQPSVGEIVAALFTEAGETLWYRARVLQLLEGGKQLQVFFVDYGNTDIVAQSDVCHLDDRFLRLPQGSVTCKLAGTTGSEEATMIEEFKLVEKVRMNIKAVELNNGVYAIELYLDDGININEQLGFIASPPPVAERASITVSTTTPPKSEALPRKSVSPQQSGSERKMVFRQTLPTFVPKMDNFELEITNVTTPELFHAQVFDKANQTELALLSHQMILDCESEQAMDIQYEQGELVCCKFTADNKWYRASILKMFPDQTAQVEYVDYGNTELVPLSLIRPITNQCIQLPLLAFKCKLSGVYPTNDGWTNESADKLKLFMGKILQAKLVGAQKDLYEVTLHEPQSGLDVGEALVNAGVASSSPQAATAGGKVVSPRQQPAAEPMSDTERLRFENDLMKQQLAAMQAQMAELLKQKN